MNRHGTHRVRARKFFGRTGICLTAAILLAFCGCAGMPKGMPHVDAEAAGYTKNVSEYQPLVPGMVSVFMYRDTYGRMPSATFRLYVALPAQAIEAGLRIFVESLWAGLDLPEIADTLNHQVAQSARAQGKGDKADRSIVLAGFYYFGWYTESLLTQRKPKLQPGHLDDLTSKFGLIEVSVDPVTGSVEYIGFDEKRAKELSAELSEQVGVHWSWWSSYEFFRGKLALTPVQTAVTFGGRRFEPCRATPGGMLLYARGVGLIADYGALTGQSPEEALNSGHRPEEADRDFPKMELLDRIVYYYIPGKEPQEFMDPTWVYRDADGMLRLRWGEKY